MSHSPWLDVDGYAGPLDHLVEQARAQRLNLAALSLTALIDQLVAAIEAGPGRLREAGDWLVLGATLLQLRSALLLSSDTTQRQAAERNVASLRQRIVLRARLAEAADRLDRRPRLGRDVFARPGLAGQGSARPTGFADLLDAAHSLLRQRDRRLAPVERPLVGRVPYWTMTEAMVALRTQETTSPRELGVWIRATAPADMDLRRARAAQAAGLMAALELTRVGALTTTQAASWAPITVSALARAEVILRNRGAFGG